MGGIRGETRGGETKGTGVVARRQEGEGSDMEERHSDVIKVAELKGCTLPPPPLPEPAHVEGL